MKVLILGATGMIGHAIFRLLIQKKEWEVIGSIRNGPANNCLRFDIGEGRLIGIDFTESGVYEKILNNIRPDIVINCVGITKHRPECKNPLISIPINAVLPHKLAAACNLSGSRLVHISSDCVFSGKKGNHTEGDQPDSSDIYGKTKELGEVDYGHSITLRTSTIGHELQTKYGLLEWFLSQQESCVGFSKAIFSGLPSIVLAEIIRDQIIPNSSLSGLYHIAAKPINKFDLLQIIAGVYGKKIDIIRDDSFSIDRSLNSSKFQAATGYIAPEWPELINKMYVYK